MNPTIFINLRNVLVKLYADGTSIRRIIADAGIDSGKIDFHSSTLNIWHSALEEAQKTGQVETLLRAVANDGYGNNPELQAVWNAYRQATEGRKIPQPTPPQAEPRRQRYLAPLVTLLLLTVSGIVWYQGCLPTGMTTADPPTSTAEPAAAPATESPDPSPTATESAPAVVVPTATLSPTVITPPTVTPTVSQETAVDLRVLDEGLSADAYLLNGSDVDAFEIGDDLVVYGEPNPGIEVAIALLKVIGKSQNALTTQVILKHPDEEIRTNMRVDGKLDYLSESQLIPVFDYVDGYLLRPTRIRLRPEHGLAVGTQLQALEYERINGEIIDALRTDTIMQITDIGASGVVAAVALIAGEWPVTGTVVSLVEAQVATSPLAVSREATPTVTKCPTIDDGTQVQENIDPASDMDCYSFTGSAQALISVYVTNDTNAGVRVIIRNPDGSILEEGESQYVGFGQRTRKDVDIRNVVLPTAGSYTILVSGFREAIGPYTLSFSYLSL